ncbi:MAG: hypothetical protein GXY77_07395 [Fibrobacter sp.]|nr:hypothetical protein [Fibrobacter sp.]
MRRVDRIPESVFGMENSSIDSNRFYSILLDAKAAAVSENMCDIADKLLLNEKENAKIALDQLWNLKKNLTSESSKTLDLLINYYQEKMDILRTKEEQIKKVSMDSRNLLEEKRRRDEEVASIKQQILECTKELEILNSKLQTLRTKEQELLLIEKQLKCELDKNENEIVNGLYEIILSQKNELGQSECEINEEAAADDVKRDDVVKNEFDSPQVEYKEPQILQSEIIDNFNITKKIIEPPVFPKSVVKTTKGRIIGEYYYDNRVYKNERHYIFNSRFFCEHLSNNIKLLRQRFNQTVYSETIQMIQDAYKRVSENVKLHFEIATNEVLNEKSLKQLWIDSKNRSIDEMERFCNRLNAKIGVLGVNYNAMLIEQMKRCTEN